MGVLLFKGGVGVGMLKWQTSALSHAVGEELGVRAKKAYLLGAQ
jgi:hypothetical protein